MVRARPLVVLGAAALAASSLGCNRKRPADPLPPPVTQASNPTPTRTTTDNSDAERRERERLERERLERERLERERLAALRSTLETPIRFDFDRSDLTAESREVLEAKIPILAASPEIRIVIEGNADDTGSDEYNLALGQRRAAAAKRYLVQRDVAAARIETASFGEERPLCTEGSDDCRGRNRRDEFRITAGTPVIARP
jgi:peptidoglycan-associated lipoprotein